MFRRTIYERKLSHCCAVYIAWKQRWTNLLAATHGSLKAGFMHWRILTFHLRKRSKCEKVRNRIMRSVGIPIRCMYVTGKRWMRNNKYMSKSIGLHQQPSLHLFLLRVMFLYFLLRLFVMRFSEATSCMQLTVIDRSQRTMHIIVNCIIYDDVNSLVYLSFYCYFEKSCGLPANRSSSATLFPRLK